MESGGRGIRGVAGWAAICLATVLMVWTSLSSERETLLKLIPEPTQYYTRQTAGFAAGDLAMRVTPHPHISYIASDGHPVPEPFLLDASFYKDRYYLYFGAAPILTVFLPFYLLTGLFPGEAAVALLFAVLGFWVSIAWVGEWRRGSQVRPPAWLWAVLLLSIGLCTGILPTLRRAMFYEVAGASGYFWSMVGLWAATKAIFRPRREGRWLTLAGFAVGMAGASRGTLLPLLALLPVLAAWSSLRRRKAGARTFRELLPPWLFAGLPSAAILLGLFAYNFARFGHPLEFGFRFQVNGMPPKMFSLSWIGHNLWYYYFARPQLYPYFPFVAPVPDLVRPVAYWSYEQAHGQAYLGILVLLLTAVMAGFWKRLRPGAPGRTAFFFALIWFLVALGPMAAAGVRANRYLLDFQPVLLGLVAFSLLLLASLPGRIWRAASACGAVVLLLGIAFNFFASLHSHGWYRDRHPAAYAEMARRFDAVAWPVLSHLTPEPGARSVTVVFPKNPKLGATEPLFVAGIYDEADSLLVQYLGEGQGRLIFEHAPYGMVQGQAFDLSPGKPVQLQLEIGSFYPPLGHPWWKGRSIAEQQQILNRVVVRADGTKRLEVQAPCYSIPPGRIVWGRRDRVLWADPAFTGSLGPRRLLAAQDDWLEERARPGKAYAYTLLLPRDRYGSLEPLASIGTDERTEMISIEYTKPGRIRFVHTRPGAIQYSPPVELLYEDPHVFTIEETGGRAGAAPGYRLWVDGMVAWDCDSARGRDTPLEFVPLSNTRKRSPARHLFGGTTLKLALVDAPGAESLRLPMFFLPPDQSGVPILSVRGGAGSGSLLIRRRDSQTAEFLWDTAPSARSVAPVQIPSGRPFAFSFEQSGGMLQLKSEGRQIWSHPAESDGHGGPPVIFWRDSAGATAEVPLLPEWKPPVLPGKGPLLLRVQFPQNRQGHAEPLVVTGSTGAGDCVYVRYLGPDSIAIGADHWGAGGPTSPPLSVDLAVAHELWISIGSLFEEQSADSPKAGTRVWLDGREVLAWSQAAHRADTATLAIGENNIGISTCEPAFTGQILEKTRQPEAPRRP